MSGFPERSAFTSTRAACLLPGRAGTAAQTRGFPPAAWNSRAAEPDVRKAGAAAPQHPHTAVGPELGLWRRGVSTAQKLLELSGLLASLCLQPAE